MNMTPEQRASESWTDTLKREEFEYQEPIIRFESGKSMSMSDSREILKKYADEALNSNTQREITLGMFSDNAIKRLVEDTGLNLKGYSSILSSSSIRHVKNRHPEDLDLIEEIPNILHNFDMAKKSLTRNKTSGKTDVSIEFYKKMDDGIVKVVELRNLNNKTLEFKTLFRDGADQKLLRELQMSPRYKKKPTPQAIRPKTDSDGFIDNSISQNDSGVKLGAFGGDAPVPNKNTGSIRDHNFDDLERLAREKGNKDWSDILQHNTTAQNIKNSLKSYFTDTFSGKYHDARDLTHVEVSKTEEGIGRLAKVLDTLDEAMDKGLYQYLTKTGGDNITPQVKELGDMIRKTIDDIGAELVRRGDLDEKGYKEWVGAYLYRQYEPHMNKSGVAGFRQNFKLDKTFERGVSKIFSPNDIKGMVGWLHKNKIIDDSELMSITSAKQMQEFLKSTNRAGLLREGKLSITSPANGKIKLRRDFTKIEREAMGEVESAKVAVPETLAKLNRLKQHSDFLRRAEKVDGVILDNKLAKTFSSQEIKSSGYTKLEGVEYGALNKKWVRADVADDIGRTYKDITQTHDDLFRMWNGYHGLWKKSKTVWNPTAHVNNTVGNIFLMHMGGLNSTRLGETLKQGYDGMQALKMIEILEAKNLTKTLTASEKSMLPQLKETAKYALEAKTNGIFGRSQLNAIMAGMESKVVKKGILGKTDEVMSKAYQMEDNFNRLSFYLTLRHNGKDSKTAKQMVDFMLPDYTRPLPKGWRFLRDSSIAPFISWSYYTMPSIVKMMGRKHTFNFRGKERTLCSPTSRGAGNAAKVIALLSGIEMLATRGEVTPLDNIPFMDGNKPEDFKGRRIAIGKDGNEINTIKTDRMIPYAELQNPPNYAKSLFSGILPNLFSTINGSQMYNGRPITYKNKDGSDKAIDWIKHLAKQYVPVPVPAMNVVDLVDSATRNKRKRRRSDVIQPRSSLQELFKQIGFNTMTFDKAKLKREQRRKKTRY